MEFVWQVLTFLPAYDKIFLRYAKPLVCFFSRKLTPELWLCKTFNRKQTTIGEICYETNQAHNPL